MTGNTLLAFGDWWVRPWYAQLQINGGGSPSGPPPVRPPLGATACRESTLVIHTSGCDLPVHVRVEVWAGDPLTGDAHADADPATHTLHVPSGRLSVSDSEDAAARGFDLPSAGHYRVRVAGHHTDTRRLYDEAVRRSTDWDDPVFQSEVALLTGRELWLLRVWPVPRPPDGR
ncbi:hypothetical protein [Actinomadura roseirufa]|uniref:hypothetical protein n=1 Tax=Actinomadura roseirufa TaxID=2094049 RepID=UPI0010415D92|nr:hypothetical protein [Actinomadura roseirufa]